MELEPQKHEPYSPLSTICIPRADGTWNSWIVFDDESGPPVMARTIKKPPDEDVQGPKSRWCTRCFRSILSLNEWRMDPALEQQVRRAASYLKVPETVAGRAFTPAYSPPDYDGELLSPSRVLREIVTQASLTPEAREAVISTFKKQQQIEESTRHFDTQRGAPNAAATARQIQETDAPASYFAMLPNELQQAIWELAIPERLVATPVHKSSCWCSCSEISCHHSLSKLQIADPARSPGYLAAMASLSNLTQTCHGSRIAVQRALARGSIHMAASPTPHDQAERSSTAETLVLSITPEDVIYFPRHDARRYERWDDPVHLSDLALDYSPGGEASASSPTSSSAVPAPAPAPTRNGKPPPRRRIALHMDYLQRRRALAWLRPALPFLAEILVVVADIVVPVRLAAASPAQARALRSATRDDRGRGHAVELHAVVDLADERRIAEVLSLQAPAPAPRRKKGNGPGEGKQEGRDEGTAAWAERTTPLCLACCKYKWRERWWARWEQREERWLEFKALCRPAVRFELKLEFEIVGK